MRGSVDGRGKPIPVFTDLNVGFRQPVDVHQLEDRLWLCVIQSKRIDSRFKARVQVGGPHEATLLMDDGDIAHNMEHGHGQHGHGHGHGTRTWEMDVDTESEAIE